MGEQKKKKNAFGTISAFLVIGALVVFTFLNYQKSQSIQPERDDTRKTVPVEVFAAQSVEFDWYLEQTANVSPLTMVNVFPKVPGKIIEKVYFDKGDLVKKGQVIARLERDVIDAQLAEAQAGIASGKAALAQAEANLSVIEKDKIRMESLWAENAVAKQKLDHVLAQYDAAVASKTLALAGISRAQAMLSQLEVLSENHVITAPQNGVVVKRHVDPGNMSAPTVPIVSLADNSQVKIVTTVTEKDLPKITKDVNVQVTVDSWPNQVFTGQVHLISPTMDAMTRTAEVEIRIPNEEGLLRPGMYARVTLILGKINGLAVPRKALNKLPGTGSYYVFVVQDNKAVLKNVSTGLSSGWKTEITRGLEEDDLVIVKGANRVKDGFAVEVSGHLDIEEKEWEAGNETT